MTKKIFLAVILLTVSATQCFANEIASQLDQLRIARTEMKVLDAELGRAITQRNLRLAQEALILFTSHNAAHFFADRFDDAATAKNLSDREKRGRKLRQTGRFAGMTLSWISMYGALFDLINQTINQIDPYFAMWTDSTAEHIRKLRAKIQETVSEIDEIEAALTASAETGDFLEEEASR